MKPNSFRRLPRRSGTPGLLLATTSARSWAFIAETSCLTLAAAGSQLPGRAVIQAECSLVRMLRAFAAYARVAIVSSRQVSAPDTHASSSVCPCPPSADFIACRGQLFPIGGFQLSGHQQPTNGKSTAKHQQHSVKNSNSKLTANQQQNTSSIMLRMAKAN